ncbi:hypothetical protein ACOMHN_030760 [Nucella lapillus]
MIRRFPEPALRMLHTFFQTCWTTGNIPKDWKKATVVAIPQNGKPPQQTSSYRPIALTPHLGKVYERVLKNRLDHHLEKNEILPLCQAGFRKGRNCMEHVVRLIEDTKKWSLKGKNKKTVATFFDIKKAFDSVWHAKLLNKMGALGITGRMYNFIQTFLDSREITVKVGPSVSRSHILDMGVPQGSVIAPTLFSIMLHDILTTLQPQKKPPTISLFADDLAIWSHISDHAITNQMPAFQRNIDSIQNYMSNNGFELSAEKNNPDGVRKNQNLELPGHGPHQSRGPHHPPQQTSKVPGGNTHPNLLLDRAHQRPHHQSHEGSEPDQNAHTGNLGNTREPNTPNGSPSPRKTNLRS